jgi:hypothetical protein
VTENANARDVGLIAALGFPGGAITLGDRFNSGIGDERHDVAFQPCGVRGTRRLTRRKPKRRIRLLQRPRFDADILAAVEFALKADHVRSQRLEDELGRLAVHCRRLLRIDIEARDLDRRSAAAQPKFKPAAAHVVEHDHFLGDAKRMVHRRDVEQRPETQPRRPLRHGR